MIGEYGPWDNDQSGAFTGSLFRWAEAHDRVKMLIYYRGVDPQNSYNIQYYPGAEKALRNHLAKPRWSPYAPGVSDLVDPPPPAAGRRRRCPRRARSLRVPPPLRAQLGSSNCTG